MKVMVVQFDDRVTAGNYGRWLEEWGLEVEYHNLARETWPECEKSPVIVLGGYMGVHQADQYPFLHQPLRHLPAMVTRGQAVLAICLGGQLLAAAMGGEVQAGSRGERGMQAIELTAAGLKDPLFEGFDRSFLSFQWHTDSFLVPPAASHLAFTEACPGQAFRVGNAYGLQFHPEVNEAIVADWCRRTGSGDGPLEDFVSRRQEHEAAARQILRNFLTQVASVRG